MDERKRKLLELQLRVDKARKDNHREVLEEDKRAHEGVDGEKTRAKKEWEEERSAQRAQLIEDGLDPEKEKLMTTSAADSEWKESRKKKIRKGGGFGWDQYNQEAQYNAYDKRVKDVKINGDEYSEQKSNLGESDFYRDANYIGYGTNGEVAPDKVDKMVNELEANIAKRKNYSRRRPHSEDSFVTYINDRNKVFNDKISRAFDKYTVEIKQNLERGTAI
eukprot:TRINITY_DN1111_c0_g1_i1.p1 TRINITY_DN1111_c0_g1~~TRINITY_DN1111_c0_g1_i1.p1  ORF type:complete len:231 (-),score=90.37 TRINITY_DN1111_c0_g1_i1:167-826(-)